MADDEKPMKSAYELAMERLRQDDGAEAPSLTDGQKRELADIDRETQAKVAEQEILLKQRILTALAAGNVEEATKLRDELEGELRRIRERGEAKKEAVRKGGKSGGDEES